MYCIQPDYDGMLGSYLDCIIAEQDEESRREAEALRLEKEYRSAIIREWAEIAIEDGEENYDFSDQCIPSFLTSLKLRFQVAFSGMANQLNFRYGLGSPCCAFVLSVAHCLVSKANLARYIFICSAPFWH